MMYKYFLLISISLFVFACTNTNNEKDRSWSTNRNSGKNVKESKKKISYEKRPNILLVVLDDVAFTDLGAWGGIIKTPNLDKLASTGVLLTNFHTAPSCSPTRSMLLSGTDNHLAGLGNMAGSVSANQKGQPGYEGYLNNQVVTLPELLRDSGYHTYMTGKWHLGYTEDTSPAARGFEKSFALLDGGAGAFNNRLSLFGPGKARYREDGKPVETLPDDFYSTAFYSERMIAYIDANKGGDRPFFGYLAYTAAHWPLQAPEESIQRYHGKFDEGYDVYARQRLEKLKQLGFIDKDASVPAKNSDELAWSELSVKQQKIEARKMEIYAAMIDDVDRYFGKLISYLKDIDEYEDTFIFVMSDNGPEGHRLDQVWPSLAEWIDACCDNTYENMGRADSYLWYGPNWARAGNLPLNLSKGFTTQGGIQVPAIAHFPKRFAGGYRSHAFTHVMDVMPTILKLTDVKHPHGGRYKTREIVSMQGRSILPLLTGNKDQIYGDNDVVGWELFGKRALRQGEWKIVFTPYHKLYESQLVGITSGKWQLYNITNDPSESHELSQKYPKKLKSMSLLWEEYAMKNNVILPDTWEGY